MLKKNSYAHFTIYLQLIFYKIYKNQIQQSTLPHVWNRVRHFQVVYFNGLRSLNKCVLSEARAREMSRCKYHDR
jgi:hypothetical protein